MVDEVDDAGQQVGEVDEAVGDRDPLVVDELLGFGVGAAALEAEEVVAAGDQFSVAGFQCPLGGNQFREFGASDAGGFEHAFPGVGEAGLFAGDAPGFEPALVAAEDVGVGFIDGLLQLGYCGELVGKGLVVAEEIVETDLVGCHHKALG